MVVVLVIAALCSGLKQGWLLRTAAVLALLLPLSLMVKQGRSRAIAPKPPTPAQIAQLKAQDTAIVRALVDAEETNLALSPKMATLARGILDLRLPGPTTEAEVVFSKAVQVIDLTPLPPPSPAGDSETARFAARSWPLASSAEHTDTVDLWRPMLEQVSFFQHANLALINGHHPEGDRWHYQGMGRFEGLAHMKSGEWHSFEGAMALTWERPKTPEGATGDWQITRWETTAMGWTASDHQLFAESLSTALPDPATVAMLRKSHHYEATVKHYREGSSTLPHPYFAPISVNQKEGIAVADVNNDGFDDIYITVRLGKNMLLVNQGDGTFLEEAARFKLDLPGHTTCALFADFDNDGDQDVILGRSLLKTSYLENREGVFHQHPIAPFMPMAVISMAAADYNMDGLLDVYLCTYRPAAPAGASPAGGVAQGNDDDFDWPDEFFDPERAREYRRRVSEHRQKKGGTVLDQLGPPNVLLVNRGNGRFEPAPESKEVGIWRNSLQATWGDYNLDGRPDLYIANDWGLDVLFRNDPSGGFTDVTQQSGFEAYGYAMGASWGDYDNDGHDDLYVSNMYSEPGRRITEQIPGLEPMFLESAAGNWLYHRSADGQYEQVAGMKSPAMTVMKAGWSWGGCFADFDNDTFLDLYVLSGYFTAPKELDSGLDLESNLWRTMVRTDENLARSSFRLSPEWKRTSAPDKLGPMIDARLAGVDRQGDRVRVHSLNGNERNHYFTNHAGRTFSDISALSGLDNPADSRGFGILDYDRDGWQDLALVNANEPLFNLYHNEMESAGKPGGVIAIRFVGGNKSASPSKEFASRDGFGARVSIKLSDTTIVREHRCGDGWSTQNSATMIVGIGGHTNVVSVSAKWPSGKSTTTHDIPEGTLLTLFENPEEAATSASVHRTGYRIPASDRNIAPRPQPVFPVATADKSAKAGFRLRVYTTFTSTCQPYIDNLPRLKHLRETLGPEGVDFVAVPIDESDNNQKLGVYARNHQPETRLMGVPLNQRIQAAAIFAKVFGTAPPLPSSVVTDGTGHIIAIQTGVPGISRLRRLLQKQATEQN